MWAAPCWHCPEPAETPGQKLLIWRLTAASFPSLVLGRGAAWVWHILGKDLGADSGDIGLLAGNRSINRGFAQHRAGAG